MFREVKNKDMTLGYPPKGVPVTNFLLDERTRILREIFILNSMLTMVDDNKSVRLKITSLEKQVETMFSDIKALKLRREELQKNKIRI